MPINSTHPDYPEYKKVAEFVETFQKGEVAIKKAGEKLVPRLSDQTDAEYKAYVDRAPIFSVVPRTVSSLISAAFQKEPFFSLPEKLEYLRDDCTNTGVPLLTFAMKVLKELLVTGRAGILVDMPEAGGKPFFVSYDGDDIRNWGGEGENQFIVIENSTLTANPEDKFDLVEEQGFMELVLEDGEYAVNIWTEDDKGDYSIKETKQPLRFGRPLDFIPFAPINSYGSDLSITEPVMLPLAQISHKHLLAACDYALALHVACCPSVMIYADVDKEEFGSFKIGPSATHILPSGSKAEWLEFTGQGIEPLQQALDRYENMMAALGARLLMGHNSSSEKATGVKSRDAISVSVLTSVLVALETALNKALKWAAYWGAADESEAYCKINKELVVTNIDSNTINALVTAYQNNSIDLETLFHNLREGSYISPETDLETFSKNLEERAKELSDSVESIATGEGVDNSQNM